MAFLTLIQAPSVSTRAAISERIPKVELNHSDNIFSTSPLETLLLSLIAIGHQVFERTFSDIRMLTSRMVFNRRRSAISNFPERDQRGEDLVSAYLVEHVQEGKDTDWGVEKYVAPIPCHDPKKLGM